MTHGTGGSDSIRAARFLMRTGRRGPRGGPWESVSYFGIVIRLVRPYRQL